MAGFKGITINTPTDQQAHIYAEDDGAIYEAIAGEDAVFAIGKRLKATVMGNNKVRIEDGVLMVGGRFGRIPYGEYVDITIENGMAGKKRNDLIVGRVETTGTGGADTFSIVVKKGVAGTSATDPAITQSSIYNAGRIREFPLYRIKIDGINIIAAEAMFETTASMKDMSKEVTGSKEELKKAKGMFGNVNKISKGRVVLNYSSSSELKSQTYVGAEYNDGIVIATSRMVGGTPYTGTNLWNVVGQVSNGYLTIAAYGGFVNGHVLEVDYVIFK